MATFTMREFQHFPTVLQGIKVLLRNRKCYRHSNILPCFRNFNTSVNAHKYAKKRKMDSVSKPDPLSSKTTSSVFAELFAKDESISSQKTDLKDLSSMKELNELEDLLNRRLSMKIKNTVLSTGEVYHPTEELEEGIDSDQLASAFGDAEGFVEEIKGKASDSKPQQKPKLHKSEAYVYGTADPNIPASESPCAGCGAILHCQDPGIPGFIPSQIFLETSAKEMQRTICKRCHVLAKHKVALDVSASPEEYITVLEEIKDKRALILLVLDVMDLPNSIFKNLPEVVGKHRPFYVIGNKVDLLPKDSTGYLERTKEMVLRYMEEYGLNTSNMVRHIALVSAKTGYGIEELVTKLLVDWERKGDVYVVGCTNVGKSTLFNSLLSSDYCRSVSRDFILSATISNWPGTTLKTLKFPVINPAPWKLAKRAKRLLKVRDVEVEEQMLKKNKLENKKRISIEESILRGKVGRTFSSAQEAALDEVTSGTEEFSKATYSCGGLSDIKESQSDEASMMNQRIKKIMSQYDDQSLESSRYCYDTPGVVNPEQIINLLNEKELTVMLAKRLVIPRTFVMSPLNTMFVSGLGRLDYIEGKRSIYFTVICATSLPVHIVKTVEAEDFYNKHIGTKELGVPLGDADRLSKLPPLQGREFSVTCISWLQSAADIIFSSIGWVSLTGNRGMKVKVKAYTPQGRGCELRLPSLLDNAVNLKGRRISGTQAYHPKIKKM